MPTLATTYSRFLNDMADMQRLSANTLRAYRYELQAAAETDALAGELDDLTLADLEDWISRGEVAASTIARRAATFNRFFDWAQRHDLCQHNPLQNREAISIKRRLPRPIHASSDLQAIDEAIRTLNPPYRLIFTLLRETGMRVSEVLALRKADVVLKRGSEALRVRAPKNRIERTVILGPTATPRSLRLLRTHLKELTAVGQQEILFRSNHGTAVSYDAVHYQWQKVCDQAGLVDEAGKPRYTIHQLRHTRGSELMAAGQPVEIIQRVLGHQDIRSTLAYAELTEAQVREALEQSPF